MKKIFMALMAVVAISFVGCKPKDAPEEPVIPEEAEYKSEIDFAGWDIAVSGIANDTLKALLEECCSGYTTAGTSGTELFLLGAYADSYDSQIEAVLKGGGACVLTEALTAENIAAFLEACGYSSSDTYANDITDLDELEMFGVHADGGIFFAYHRVFTDEETEETVTTETIVAETGEAEEEPADGEYKEPEQTLFSTWEYAALYGAYKWYADILADKKAYEEANPEQTVNAPRRAPKKAEEKNQRDIEEIIMGCPYTIALSHTWKRFALPKHAGRDQDVIKDVTLSVIAKYNMRQVFVYQTPNAGTSGGDYYVVKADLEWVNSGMYRGVRQIDHGGATNLRYCGLIPYSCTMHTTPILANGYSIEIPAGGSVLPETVNRQTNHSETRSFNIGLSATGGGGHEWGKTPSKGSNWQAQVGVTAGWGWNNTKSYVKYDWYIVQDAGYPGAGHTVRMDDDWLPKPTVTDPGFEQVRENYGSTIHLHESWIWHIPETKTDGTEAPLKIKFSMKAQYTWMDHFRTPCTRTTYRYRFGYPSDDPFLSPELKKEFFPIFEKVIPILPTNRAAAGIIKMTNNMVDDKENVLTVSNVTFVDADSQDKKILYADADNIYAYGSEMTYSLLSKYKYNIYFKAGQKAQTAKWYKTHKPYSIGLGQTITISDLYYIADEVAEEDWHPAD